MCGRNNNGWVLMGAWVDEGGDIWWLVVRLWLRVYVGGPRMGGRVVVVIMTTSDVIMKCVKVGQSYSSGHWVTTYIHPYIHI